MGQRKGQSETFLREVMTKVVGCCLILSCSYWLRCYASFIPGIFGQTGSGLPEVHGLQKVNVAAMGKDFWGTK